MSKTKVDGYIIREGDGSYTQPAKLFDTQEEAQAYGDEFVEKNFSVHEAAAARAIKSVTGRWMVSVDYWHTHGRY